MISISDTGGKDWATAISAKGINIGLMTSGVINTDKIYIGNEKNFSFRWDSTGLNAYTKKTDNKGNELDTYNYGKFVRFDRFGLYGYSEGEVFVPKNISEVEQSADFGLTWNGFFLKSDHSKSDKGRIEISTKNDFQLFGAEGTERIKIGYLGEDENGHRLYGLRLKNLKGNETVGVDSEGNITITGTINAKDGTIGGWSIQKDNLSSVNSITNEGILLKGSASKICSNEWETSLGANGWCITNSDAVFNNITLRGSLKCAVLEYGEIQAVGGIMLIRPSTTIKSVSGDTITVENARNFTVGHYCKLCVDVGEMTELDKTF